MYVAELHVANFRHIAGAHIGPLPRIGSASEVVVLAGPNGGGKSSILELLSYAFSDVWGYQWQLRRTFGSSSFEIRFGLSETDLQRIQTAINTTPELDAANSFHELASRRSYSIAWNYPDGEYEKERALNDSFRTLARAALFDGVKTLFLRSDRYYQTTNYNRSSVLEWQRRLAPNYNRTVALNLADAQYTDQIEFLIEQAWNYPRTLGLHHLAVQRGTEVGPAPANPLDAYDSLFQQLFPQYRLAEGSEQLRDRLYIVLPNGQELPFTDLSSGEQEVFFIVSIFLRNDVQNSVVFLDEPELHLHPELARRMVKVMLRIKPGNQIWLATHNADLVDEAGRDRTYFVTRPSPADPVSVTRASDEQTEVELLRTIFGDAGYVGLARRLVFLEGDASSPDRRVFSSLFPLLADQIRFVPLNSSENALRIHRGMLALLGASLGHSQYFLIRDRDYLPPAIIEKYQQDTSGRIFVLQRHEIENYLLDADTIREVAGDLLGKEIAVDEIERLMRESALSLAGAVFRDMTKFRLNSLFQLEDCSIDNFEAAAPWLGVAGDWNEPVVTAAQARFAERLTRINADIASRVKPEVVKEVTESVMSEISSALTGVGGKETLSALSRVLGFPPGPVMTNAVIRAMAARPSRIDPELTSIVTSIVG